MSTPTGYEAQYRKKAADGQDPADWTAYSGTLGSTATTLNLPDLDAGATYEVQVRAVSDGESGPWSDIGEGRANRPPRSTEPANVQPINTLLWGGDDSVRSLNDKFTDDDGDSLTYSAAATHPGIFRVGIEGENSDKLRIHVLNPATSKVTYEASDGYGGYASKTIDVSGSADAFNGADLSRSVAENSAAGTAVGDPVTGNPYSGAALTYSLTGEASTSGAFVVDSASGQISVKQGASLDYETKSSYTGKVKWTVQGQGASADVTIEVTDVGPGQPAAPTVTRTQFSEPTNPALDVTWTAPDANGTTITGYEAQLPQARLDRMDGRRRRPGRNSHNLQPAGPGCGLDLRVPGAGSRQWRIRPLVGHRGGPRQPPAAVHRTGKRPTYQYPSVGRGRLCPDAQRQVCGRRRRLADILGLGAASWRAQGRYRG